MGAITVIKKDFDIIKEIEALPIGINSIIVIVDINDLNRLFLIYKFFNFFFDY